MDILRRAASCFLLFFMLGLVASVAYARAQDLERRLDNLEAVQSERRLTAIETRLETIDSVGKGILVIVAAQLLLQGLGLKKNK